MSPAEPVAEPVSVADPAGVTQHSLEARTLAAAEASLPALYYHITQ